MKYTIGDVVYLTSGGLPMTIEFIMGDDNPIECAWFDKNNELHHDTFFAKALTFDKPTEV